MHTCIGIQSYVEKTMFLLDMKTNLSYPIHISLTLGDLQMWAHRLISLG